MDACSWIGHRCMDIFKFFNPCIPNPLYRRIFSRCGNGKCTLCPCCRVHLLCLYLVRNTQHGRYHVVHHYRFWCYVHSNAHSGMEREEKPPHLIPAPGKGHRDMPAKSFQRGHLTVTRRGYPGYHERSSSGRKSTAIEIGKSTEYCNFAILLHGPVGIGTGSAGQQEQEGGVVHRNVRQDVTGLHA